MAKDQSFQILDPFKTIDFGIADWADGIKAWATENRDVVQPIKWFVNDLIVAIEGVMQAIPPVAMLGIIWLIAWQAAGQKMAVFVVVCLIFLGLSDPPPPGLWR